MSTSYRINEIFYSLQGEGANVGTPAVFVRFSGCNLSCDFCDTDFASYTLMSAEQIVEAVTAFPARLVVLTGGEPSLQVDKVLIDALHAVNKFLAIETNGTKLLPQGIDFVTVSPKETGKLALFKADEVKLVYQNQDVEKYLHCISATYYFLQPCSVYDGEKYVDNRADVIRYCLEHPQWRLSLQTHKILNIR